MDTKMKVGLGIGAGVIALGSAVGVGAMAANLGTDTTASPQTGYVQPAGEEQPAGETPAGDEQGRPAQGGPADSELAAALAEELGVEQSEVEAALEELIEEDGDTSGQAAGPPTGRPGEGDRSQLEELAPGLAEKLGLDEETVRAALEEVMPSGGPGRPGGGQPSGEPRG